MAIFASSFFCLASFFSHFNFLSNSTFLERTRVMKLSFLVFAVLLASCKASNGQNNQAAAAPTASPTDGGMTIAALPDGTTIRESSDGSTVTMTTPNGAVTVTTTSVSAADASSPTNMWVANTTVVVRRRLIEVTNWEAMKTACGSSGTVILSDDFVMGTYTPTPSPQSGGIDFSGKQLVIIGNNKTLDAGEKGRFFYGSGSGSSLEVRNVTMRNGKNTDIFGNGGAISVYEGTAEIYESTFDSNIATEGAALYATAGAYVKVHDSQFISNSATYESSAASSIDHWINSASPSELQPTCHTDFAHSNPYVCEQALDGSAGWGFHNSNNNGGNNQWIDFTFDSVVTLDAFRHVCHNDWGSGSNPRSVYFKYKVLSNGNWLTAFQGDSTKTCSTFSTHPFDAKSARYWRFGWTSHYQSSYPVTIREINFHSMGSSAGGGAIYAL
jgi:hypothetical protein